LIFSEEKEKEPQRKEVKAISNSERNKFRKEYLFCSSHFNFS